MASEMERRAERIKASVLRISACSSTRTHNAQTRIMSNEACSQSLCDQIASMNALLWKLCQEA